MKLTDEEILKACDSTKWIAPEGLALDIGRAIEAAVLAQGEPVERPCHVFNVTKFGSLTEWEPTTMAFALPDGTHALYTHPAPVNTALLERITKLEQALDVALEAFETYFNQYPHMQKGYTLDAIEILKEVRRGE